MSKLHIDSKGYTHTFFVFCFVFFRILFCNLFCIWFRILFRFWFRILFRILIRILFRILFRIFFCILFRILLCHWSFNALKRLSQRQEIGASPAMEICGFVYQVSPRKLTLLSNRTQCATYYSTYMYKVHTRLSIAKPYQYFTLGLQYWLFDIRGSVGASARSAFSGAHCTQCTVHMLDKIEWRKLYTSLKVLITTTTKIRISTVLISE